MALIAAIDIADAPSVWDSLGFTATEDTVNVSGVAHRLGVAGTGMVGWSLFGVSRGGFDGLATSVVEDVTPAPDVAHPNHVIGLDHVVVRTPDHARTVGALEAIGLPVLRVRETGKMLQAFFRLGPVILELVGGVSPSGDGPASFLGLAWTSSDLDATAAFLGDRLHAPKDAVQPGRLIATLDKEAGSAVSMAFMSPPPA